MPPGPTEVFRGAVTTCEGKTNDVILHAPPTPHEGGDEGLRIVVFFGGDVQDYPEVMSAHKHHHRYTHYSLTHTAALLAHKFKTHHIIVVKPSRMEGGTFSCYDNFVDSNSVGAPTHTQGTHTALAHLAYLLHATLTKHAHADADAHERAHTQQTGSEENSVPMQFLNSEIVKNCSSSSSSGGSGSSGNSSSSGNRGSGSSKKSDDSSSSGNSSSNSGSGSSKKSGDSSSSGSSSSVIGDFQAIIGDIKLIGFSKGCVVLNQIITDIHSIKTTNDDDDGDDGDGDDGDDDGGGGERRLMQTLIGKFVDLYWLDGGHSGGHTTWVTSPPILTTLATTTKINIHIHVTPYQVCDALRPWIGRECKAFYETLKSAGARVNYTLHFTHRKPSLSLHFELLREFV